MGIDALSGPARVPVTGNPRASPRPPGKPHVRRPAVRFTAADDPGPFAGDLLLFYGVGIAAVLFGTDRLRH